MDSRTKRQLSSEQLAALARDALGAGVATAEEMSDGFANAVWRLGLDDGRAVVLKVSPPPELEQLTYERDLLRTEAMVYRLAASTGLPLPELLHHSFDDPLIGGDYLILSALDGTPWNHASLPEADDKAMRFELGRLLARLHTISGDGRFGYPQGGLNGPTWRDAFLLMTGAVLDDAIRYGIPLPVTQVEIAKLVHANAEALDEVTRPALVHFDMWPGNVFLTLTGGTPAIQALIDHERAFWGDPLADFVTPTIFGDLFPDDPLLLGYRAGGGEIVLDDQARVRDALYRTYLYLILLVENGPRRYPEEAYGRIRDLASRHLIRSCDFLSH
ncbi:aminoglycoside phosphotransferase family protein [Thermopolyspora sp. NPDC052614]|uniref:phosphotransferase family protein n=1 Tax=Thermopolyspora sp. NPDC052614 TaxID=3155682 RepID=UPI003422D3FE